MSVGGNDINKHFHLEGKGLADAGMFLPLTSLLWITSLLGGVAHIWGGPPLSSCLLCSSLGMPHRQIESVFLKTIFRHLLIQLS